MSAMQAKLDFWAKNNLNVLLRGRHGTGKTQMVQNTLDEHKIKWIYFSASTMDPWVDFVGVPKEKTVNGYSYLELIRPEIFAKDEVEAIFFDELNRAPKKVRNAVMELIQFKSINGKKFNNLRFIWGAINPEGKDDEDSEYDVEKLDPAQLDRFHIIVDVDDRPNKAYFNSTYGANGIIAIEWWTNLNATSKRLVSPRRLDYALKVYQLGGDISDVLPKEINVHELVTQLVSGSFASKLKGAFKNDTEATTILNNENFFKGAIPLILKNKNYLEYFPQFFPKEKFNDLVVKDIAFRKHIISNKAKEYKDNLNDILTAGTAPKKIIKEIRENTKSILPASGGTPLALLNHWNGKHLLEATPNRIKSIEEGAATSFAAATEDDLIACFALVSASYIRTYGGDRVTNLYKKMCKNIQSRAKDIGTDLSKIYEKATLDSEFHSHLFYGKVRKTYLDKALANIAN